MASGAARLGSILAVEGRLDVAEEDELEDVDEDVDVDELDEQVLQSESESLGVDVCPCMLPVVVCVSV